MRFSKMTTVVLLSTFCTLFRVPLLDGSFWMDEAAQALESSRPFSQQLMIAEDFQPPLFHLIVHALTYLSSQEWWLRTASLTASVITSVFVYLIARKLKLNTFAQLIAPLFMITSSFDIFYAQELRPYALSSMFAVMSWYFLIQSTQHKNRAQSLYFVGFTLATVGGMYSTYLYPFLAVSQLAYIFFFHRTTLIKTMLSFCMTALLYLPWLPSLYTQLQVGQLLREKTINWGAVVGTPILKALPLVPAKFMFGVKDIQLDASLLMASFLYIGLAVTFLVFMLSKPKQIFKQHTLILLLCWFLIPLLSSWLFSFVIPIIQPKRVLFLLPAFALILAYVLQYISEKIHKPTFMYFATFCLIMINLSGTFQYWTDARLQRENWRHIIQTIDSRYSPQDTIIVFAFDGPFAPWVWYPHQPFPFIATGTKTVLSVEEIELKMKPAIQYEQVIVFDYLTDLTDPNRTILSWLKSYNYVESRVIDQPNIGFVRIYTKGGLFAER